MVLINCKRCNKDYEMPNKRFKICTNCKPKKTQIEKYNLKEDKCSFSLLDIFYLITSIIPYLTIYEVYSLYTTCKEIKGILSEDKTWVNLIKRDYKLVNDCSVRINNAFKPLKPISLAIGLDRCDICHCCQTSHVDRCVRYCDFNYHKISKTDCIEVYKLTLEDLSELSYEIKYNNFFKKYITMFNMKEIKRFVSIKYKGYTNFVLFKNKLDNILTLKRKKREENKLNKELLFEAWKLHYQTTFDYSNMSENERQTLLDLNLLENEMVRRDDSKLCKAFIRGYVNDKCVDHVVAILKMTHILFTYNHIAFINFNDRCNSYLEEMMFKNKNKNIYSWIDAVEDTHTRFKKQLLEYKYY